MTRLPWPLTGLLALLALLFGCDSKAPYQRKGDGWYFEDVRLQDAKEPFTPLNASFAKDAQTAWFRSQPIAGSEPASFEALDKHHAKDARQVWYADTFRSSQEYFLVKRLRVEPIKDADAPSFRLITARAGTVPGYARDRQRVYFEGMSFKVADLESFEPLDYGFARDRVQGYYQQQAIPGSTGAGFVALDSHYARDDRHVFHVDIVPRSGNETGPRLHSIRLAGAQPASFKVLDPGYAIDAGQAYHRGLVLTKDVAAFVVLPSDYAKDSRQVFHRGQPVAGADAASFEVLSPATEEADARDASRRYLQGRVAR